MKTVLISIILAGSVGAFGCAGERDDGQDGQSENRSGLRSDGRCEEQPQTGPAGDSTTDPGKRNGTPCENPAEPRACVVSGELQKTDPAEFKRQLEVCRQKGIEYEAKYGKAKENPGEFPSPPPAPKL